MFHTLLINLEDSPNRLEFQVQQLHALNINFERLKAVSVDDISSEDYEKMSNDWERKLKKSEVACCLSHFQAWKKVIELNKPVLILEDDVLLSCKTKEILEEINSLNIDYNHINLEIRGRRKLLGKNKIPIEAEYGLLRLYQDRSGSAAYMLTPEGAKMLIAHKDKHGIGLVDALISSCYSLESFQIVPAAAIQSDQIQYYGVQSSFFMPSIIGGESKIDRHNISLVKKIIFKYRRIAAQMRMGWQLGKYFTKSERKFVDLKSSDFLINL